MDFEQEQQFVAEMKRYVTENLPLSKRQTEIHCFGKNRIIMRNA